MAIRTDYVIGEERTAAQVNEENTQILANLTSINSIIYNRRLLGVHTLVNVTNTTVETTLLSVSLAGGNLGTLNSVYGKCWISRLRGNTTNTLTLRLKYGAQTLITAVITVANGELGAGFIEFEIRGAGGTSAQDADLLLHTATNATILNTSVTSCRFYANGTGTVDSTAAQNIVLTAQWNAASNNNIIDMNTATLSMIRG